MSEIKKGKRSVMTRRVLNNCPEPQTDFNRLHTVFPHTVTAFKTLLYGFKTTLYHE